MQYFPFTMGNFVHPFTEKKLGLEPLTLELTRYKGFGTHQATSEAVSYAVSYCVENAPPPPKCEALMNGITSQAFVNDQVLQGRLRATTRSGHVGAGCQPWPGRLRTPPPHTRDTCSMLFGVHLGGCYPDMAAFHESTDRSSAPSTDMR